MHTSSMNLHVRESDLSVMADEGFLYALLSIFFCKTLINIFHHRFVLLLNRISIKWFGLYYFTGIM
jgi:hypothetical protein